MLSVNSINSIESIAVRYDKGSCSSIIHEWGFAVKQASCLIVMFGVVVGFLVAASDAAAPTFKNKQKVELEIGEYKASSELAFAGRKAKREFSVEMEMAIHVPDALDLVCISDEMRVLSAIDEKGKALNVRSKSRSSSVAKDDFNAILSGSAKTELKDAKLIANAYTVKLMVVQANVVIGKKRAEVIIPADVVEDLRDVGNGIRLRLSSLKIDSKRMVQLTIDYKRLEGTRGTILESVYLIDNRGNNLGGGRWNKGLSIFAPDMEFKGQYKLAAGATISKIKCVLLTQYEVTPIEFKITEIFQQ